MTNNPGYITPISDLFRHAAPYAIYKWVESEKDSLDYVKSQLDEESITLWLTQWKLHRANPKGTRTKLMKCLTKLRPRIIEAHKHELPQIVDDGVDMLARATNKRQMSLMSKFAFSLRPSVGVPYDKFALEGLRKISGRSIDNQDYKTYFKEFNRFATECGKALEEMGETEALMPLWQPFMGKILFKRRTADKSLMIMGDFVPDGRLDFWCKFQENYRRCP